MTVLCQKKMREFLQGLEKITPLADFGGGRRHSKLDMWKNVLPNLGVENYDVLDKAGGNITIDLVKENVIGKHQTIVCCDTLEHVTSPQRVVDNIVRALLFGGKAWITAPFCFKEHGKGKDDFWRFSLAGLNELFSSHQDIRIVSSEWIKEDPDIWANIIVEKLEPPRVTYEEVRSWYSIPYFEKNRKAMVYSNRLRYFFLKIMEHKPKRVLDVGCGFGFLVDFLRKRGVDAYGVDIVDVAKDIIPDHFQVVDTRKLPFQDKEFDVVFSSDVFEHIREEDLTQIYSEMQRVGKVVLAEISPKPTPKGKDHNYHITVHPLEWWRERLPEIVIVNK